MLRTSRKSSNSSANNASDQKSSKRSLHTNGARGGGRSSNNNAPSSVFPKSLIGTLIIIVGGFMLFLISRLDSRSTSRRRSDTMGGGGGNDNLRVNNNAVVKNNIQPDVAVAAKEKIQTTVDSVGTTSPATNATLHIIFSTDCGSFQHWQSYLFFHAALKVQQPGYVTRIASGCTDEQLEEEKKWHYEHIQSKMSDRFRVHFTPHFSGVKDPETGEVKGDYKFFNKPFGLKHFLEYNELLGFDESGKEMKHPGDIIILTDPDFLLLRPITDDFSNERETLVGGRRKSIYEKKESHFVTHGNPYAQTYGLGTQWRKFDLDAIAGADSPAKDVEQKEGGLNFPAGPPYIGTARDMYNIAVTWSEFAPKVHKQYPHLLAEMYAYCIAAAHLRLPHMLIDSLMVSAAGIGGEGWKFVKDIPAQEVCTFASNPNHSVHPVPSVIHYCQRYAVDKYFWGKRKIPHKIFTCEHPLLVEPPSDLGSGKYLSIVNRGRGGKTERKEISAEKEKMEAFMVCALTKATNDAMVNFKTNHCDGGGNMKKTYDVWAEKDVA
ncbi:hypothetical protein ACHAXR_007925 [Thalassiosira sp. AJA248-18]